MLSKISLLSFVLFAVIYPLCFWISFKDPLKQGFHKFHIGLPTVIAGVVTAVVLRGPLTELTKQWVLIWFIVLLLVCLWSWAKEFPSVILVTLPFFPGIKAYTFLHMELLRAGGATLSLSILGGFILAACLFAMNLGHWYLNVHGLPISHLRRATYVFWGLCTLRLIWDGYLVCTQTVYYQGEPIPLILFMQRLDGFFLWIAIFFGTVFPVIGCWFVRGVLDLKNNQSATGILYVLLSAVLIGDLSYKYYLVKFGVAL